MILVKAAINSAKTIAYHMPSTSNNIGNSNTAPSSKTNVLKNDINADTCPLFKAVKKAEPKIAIPVNKYENDMILNACTAPSTNCLLSCKNKIESG